MVDLKTQIDRYLHDALGVAATITPWKNGDRTPLFLQDRYRFFACRLLGQRCLFMADKDEREESPAVVRKHVDQLRGKWDDAVVYVRERITAYNRKRLVEHKVPFIVPGNQMYLPTLGIDLREHFRKLRQHKSGLGPAAQVVLVHALLQNAADLGPTTLAKKLGYSVMAMSRALDELETAALGQPTAAGRERRLRLAGSRREVWEKAQSLLRNPVRHCYAIRMAGRRRLPGPYAGLSALAHYTMLAESENPAIALNRVEWKLLQENDSVENVMAGEPGATTVEVWSYSPMLFVHDGRVDRLSLYLSLRDMQDERIQAALERMVKEVEW